jgi:hypothetical protein
LRIKRVPIKDTFDNKITCNTKQRASRYLEQFKSPEWTKIVMTLEISEAETLKIIAQDTTWK